MNNPCSPEMVNLNTWVKFTVQYAVLTLIKTNINDIVVNFSAPHSISCKTLQVVLYNVSC